MMTDEHSSADLGAMEDAPSLIGAMEAAPSLIGDYSGGFIPDVLDKVNKVIIQTGSGTEYEIYRPQWEKWPRVAELISSIKEGQDRRIFVLDIDDIQMQIILKFLYLYSIPINYFGIHCPLKFKEIPKDPDAAVVPAPPAPDGEEIPKFKEGSVDLEYSGIPRVYIDLVDTIDDPITFRELYMLAFNENIIMFRDLLAAYFAWCCAKYQWKNVHYYFLMVLRENRFLENKKRSKAQQDYIDKVIVSLVGVKTYKFDPDRVPADLELHEKRKAEIPFISECEILNDYKALRQVVIERETVPMTEEEKEHKRYLGIHFTEYFTDKYNLAERCPLLNTMDFAEPKVVKPDGTQLQTEPEKITEIFKNGYEDLYGDSDDDDKDSYTDIFDDPDCPPYEPTIYKAFMDKKDRRQESRQFIINRRLDERSLLKDFTYDFLRRQDYSYFEEREFRILQAFIHYAKFKGFETMGAEELTVYGTDVGDHGIIPAFKLNLLTFIPPDTYDPCEDGYADMVPEQTYLPDEVFPLAPIDDGPPAILDEGMMLTAVA